MILKSLDGWSLELNIVGYEFPELPEPASHDDWPDADWLMMLAKLTMPEGTWQKTDPFLAIREVQTLADEFERLSKGQLDLPLNGWVLPDELPFVPYTIIFMEPLLNFRGLSWQENFVELETGFNRELQPPWITPESPWSKILQITYTDLATAAHDLRIQLSNLPPRPPV